MRMQIEILALTFCSLTSHAQSINNSTKDSLRIVICKILSVDQDQRKGLEDKRNQKQIDSIHFYQLTAITKKFGYPDRKRIGENDCSVDPFIILLIYTIK